MPYTPNFGSLGDTGEPLEAPKPEAPFRIAVLADFSARQSRGLTGSTKEIIARRLLPVSRDTLDNVLAKLDIELELPVGDDKVTVPFAALDDFHPDQLHDKIDPIQDAYDADEKSALMNGVLHHPDFQALEATWRGLDWLLARVAKGGKVDVLLIDVSLAELAADLKASDDLTSTGIYQLLIEKGVRGPKGAPWAALVGNYAFDLSGPHAELLGRIAKIAAQANAPFLTTVHPQVLDKSFNFSADAGPAWQALRSLPEAALLGVSVPRFLLRLPYGENTKSIDQFSLEEMASPPDRSHYLWANPALACAALLAQGYHKQGWAAQPGVVLDLENLPIHVYTVDDEQEVTLAEAWLVRPQTEKLTKQGFMSFLCVRDKGAMQLLNFSSLATPPEGQATSALQGRWSGSTIAAPPPSATPPAAKVGMMGEVPAAPPKVPAPLIWEEVAPSPPPEPAAPPPKPAAAKPAPPPPKAAPPAPAPAPAPPPTKATPKPAPAPAPAAPPAPVAQKPPPAKEPEPAPAPEEEMDPDLAALLKELER